LRGGGVAGLRQSRRIVKLVKVAVLALSMIVWTAVVGYGVLAGRWHRALVPAGDTPAFMAAARQMMSSEPHGDLAIALVARDELFEELFVPGAVRHRCQRQVQVGEHEAIGRESHSGRLQIQGGSPLGSRSSWADWRSC
jgi:hypothetical protein